MSEGSDYILLKWGTLKGWDLDNSPEAIEALKRYHQDETSPSVMLQHDTIAQKQALCDAIRAVNGEIRNDWSGEVMSKDDAIKYVLEYGR